MVASKILMSSTPPRMFPHANNSTTEGCALSVPACGIHMRISPKTPPRYSSLRIIEECSGPCAREQRR